jgi:hypothetical protein
MGVKWASLGGLLLWAALAEGKWRQGHRDGTSGRRGSVHRFAVACFFSLIGCSVWSGVKTETVTNNRGMQHQKLKTKKTKNSVWFSVFGLNLPRLNVDQSSNPHLKKSYILHPYVAVHP